MSKLCQNWQKWQWPIWCISSRWKERGQALFAFQKYLLLCNFLGKDLLPFKAKQIFVENKAILKHDQHVARRIGHKWVATCNTLPSLDPKKKDDRGITWRVHTASQPGGGRFPRTISGGSLVPPPPSLCSSPLKGADLTAPPEQPGSRLGRFWATGHFHFFGVTTIDYFEKYFFAL